MSVLQLAGRAKAATARVLNRRLPDSRRWDDAREKPECGSGKALDQRPRVTAPVDPPPRLVEVEVDVDVDVDVDAGAGAWP